MITGDNKTVAEKIGNNLGIDTIISEVLPADNDSPALVKSDVRNCYRFRY